MVVRVDEAGGDQAVGHVDGARGRGLRVGAAADGLDEVVGDGHPTAREFAPLRVDGGHHSGVAEEQVSHGVSDQARESTMSWTSATVVRGFTTQMRSTVSPAQAVGTTKATPVASMRSLHAW